MKKTLYIIAGCVSFVLAIIGIPLPILPTTPLLLLAGFCFSRSSDRFNNWLRGTKVYKYYVGDYLETRIIKRERKKQILIQVWILMGISIIFAPFVWMKILFFTMTTIMSFVLFKFVPETPKYDKVENNDGMGSKS
ncbi:YbaN family protein [Streptococcus uberis]|uniref:YbaN family protein n=1 Tax=Streptococcus uberis TaxID=1349 RepID=UPI001FF5B81C|nr:YbaN family protein [Streptococcus uberis]MCK1167202.1 YbaN family protein [Streptococcus uberis]MCK1169186.1 YbaN family protein [Streptococcus uberis]MCK1187702.1 YbaN family protein [Streptococcus uberis]MCK1212828.1 YbaN family protein [Streptococcus uberis]MCK1242600.1 YbaN family protein [Streptococcus uberis]